MLAHFRSEPITLLEVGVHNGASLDMWESYFPKARIVGLDISPVVKKHERDRVDIVVGSQADENFLYSVGSLYKPNVIIDDGSHIPEHQIITFNALISHLADSGLYIIEDVAPGPAYDLFIGLASKIFLNERPHDIAAIQVTPQAFIFKKSPRDDLDCRVDIFEEVAQSSRLPSESLLYLSEYMRRRNFPNTDSLRIARQASGHEPTNCWIRLLLSKILMEEGNQQEALEQAEAAAHWALQIAGAVPEPIQNHLEFVERQIRTGAEKTGRVD